MGQFEKIPALEEVTYKHKGYFDMNKLYSNVADVLENNYLGDVTEKKYSLFEQERNSEINENGEKELFIKFTAELRYSDYFMIELLGTLKLVGISTEVEIEGILKKMSKGTASLCLRGVIIPEWDDKESKIAILEILKLIKERMFRLHSNEEKCIKEAEKMRDILKEEFYKNVF
jgi:hypothetical protein